MNTTMKSFAIPLILISVAARAPAAVYFAIHVTDADTGRGVPLVALTTTGKIVSYTDSNGYIAFNEPGLMDRDIWFDIASWGYAADPGTLGFHGVTLHPTAGGKAEIKIRRTQIARRLYRTTGQGIFRDTVLLGMKPPFGDGLLDAGVIGQDTVQTAVYRGRMFWCWGDTDRASFPLGNFHTTAATSKPPAEIDASVGFAPDYFTDKPGEVRQMVQLEHAGSHPIWIDGLTVTNDAGTERLLARYCLVDGKMKPIRAGIVQFDDAAGVFKELVPIPLDAPLYPSDHPVKARVGAEDYFYFPRPFATVRVKADYASVKDLSAYEGWTCVKPDGTVDRVAGKVVWSWRRGAAPADVGRLVKDKLLADDESPHRLRDAATGKPIRIHNGSIAWNPYLKRWIMIFGQGGGDSALGEIWLAEADAIEGPWGDAVKVATHARPGCNQDLYNPMQHPEFARENGRLIYFEGTFVNTFSGSPIQVPRYNYNNLMYEIDLADPRIATLSQEKLTTDGHR
jgi:hypothetical protein